MEEFKEAMREYLIEADGAAGGEKTTLEEKAAKAKEDYEKKQQEIANIRKAQAEFDAAKAKKAQERVKEAAMEARMEQEAKDKANDLARANEMKAANKRMTELTNSLTKLGKQIKELDMTLKKGNLP